MEPGKTQRLALTLTTFSDPANLAFNILSDMQLLKTKVVPIYEVLRYFNVEDSVLFGVSPEVRGVIQRRGKYHSLGVNADLPSLEQRIELAWLLSSYLHTNVKDVIPNGYQVNHVVNLTSPVIAKFNDDFASHLLLHSIPEKTAKRLLNDVSGVHTSKYAHKRGVPTRILLSRLADFIPSEHKFLD